MGCFEVIGFLDDIDPAQRPIPYGGKKVLGGREALGDLRRAGVREIALGFGDCAARLSVGRFIRKEGFPVATIVHVFSSVSSTAVIGEGSVVLSGARVDPACVVGKFCIINNNSAVCHGTVIGDGAHICPGANIASNATIGRGVWIGIGATVIGNLTIGAGSFIGAGAVVVEDIPAGVLAYGSPARVVRSLHPHAGPSQQGNCTP
jgi:acetyltransferase EpsM